MRPALLAVLLLASVSCGQRPSPATDRAQANQSAAEAASGMAAMARMLGPALTPVAQDVLDGSAAFARATIGQDVQPVAVWTPDKILADPHAFRQAGVSAERHANGTWNLWALGVAAMTAMPLLLYAAKFIPVVGPYVESIGGALWQAFASRATKDQEEQRDVIYGHAATIYQTATGLLTPSGVQVLNAKLPPPVLDILTAPSAAKARQPS